MRFGFDPEHDELRHAVRRLLATPDAHVGTRLAEMGVYGLAIPERFGGGGYGLLELGVVCQEAGRAALSAPLLSITLACDLLVAGGDDAPADNFLPLIAAGELVAVPAIDEDGAGWDAPPRTAARPAGDGWMLTGAKSWVLDGAEADLFVVYALAPDGPGLFTVQAGTPGLTVEPLETIDISRKFARVLLQDAKATRVTMPDASGAVRRARDRGLALLAADQVGIAARCLEMSVSWALQREQFGRVIGSFQAIKHKLASARLELEAAEASCLYALWAAQEAPGEFAATARIAAYTCGEAGLLAAGENIQVHGGIGATWEHPAHVYLRRATTGQRLLADPQALLEDLAQVVEGTVRVSTAVAAA